MTRSGSHLVAPLLMLSLAAGPAFAGKWEAIEQLNGQSPVPVVVEGKSRVYFRVSPERPIVVPVEGPARLRIVSRAELPAGKPLVSYTLAVSEAGREIERNATESSASDRVQIPGRNGAIGKSRRMAVDLPAGSHRLTLSAAGASLLVRVQVAAPATGEESTVSLTPVLASQSVLVTEGEKTIPYYTVQAAKPARFRIVGPTTLDLITRLDFGPTMRGTQRYRLRIAEGTTTLRRVEYRTTKATTAMYGNIRDRVPSKFDRLRLVIPLGVHEVSVELTEPVAGAVQVHARSPQPTVGGEE